MVLLPSLDVHRHGGLTGWHHGVLAAQKSLGFEVPMRGVYEYIEESMPPQHRHFHAHNLHFLPITLLDSESRPWVSFLTPSDGVPDSGWVTSPSDRELVVQTSVALGDPFRDHVFSDQPFLVASVGVELSTRRRNKFAGEAVAAMRDDRLQLHMRTDEACGNCPKYIGRQLHFSTVKTSPRIIAEDLDLAPGAALPDDVIEAIRSTSISFLGSYFKPCDQEAAWHQPHLGCNHRGGKVGFIRVRKDGQTVVMPDFCAFAQTAAKRAHRVKAGNRQMTSLGNIETTHVAALTIPNFSDGSVLYLTGTAQNLYGQEAQKVMSRVHAVTLIRVTGYRLVHDVLPIRSDHVDEYSPYNPPIRPLAEENAQAASEISETTLTLSSIVLHAPDLATFTFNTSKPVGVLPGQYAILDTTPLFGKKYAHSAAPGEEKYINDDGIRSWTISASTSNTLSLTMREMPHGKVTGVLLALARGIATEKPEVLADCSILGVAFDLIGIGGSFRLSENLLADAQPFRLLYVAAGIGITPLLAILASLEKEADITVIWSIRDPVDVALDLLRHSLLSSKGRTSLRVHLWVTGKSAATSQEWPFQVTIRQGRIPSDAWAALDLSQRQIFLCGTTTFERAAIEGLVAAGADAGAIKRESFAF